MAKYEKRQGKKGITWSTRMDLGPDPVTGIRRQKRISAPTRKELEAKVAEVRHKVNQGAYVNDSRLTVDGFILDHWLPATAQSVKPSTLASYEQNIRKHIVPALGDVRLVRLTAPQVQSFYNAKIEEGMSPTTVRMLHAVLHNALKQAERWGFVARNVCTLVDPPKAKSTETVTWTADQAARFIRATSDDELGVLWQLAIVTGMRRGEVLGLRWSDVDWRRGQIAIRRTLSRVGGEWAFGTPKTSRDRSVSVSPAILAILDGHRARQQVTFEVLGVDWTDDELIFTRADGEPYDPGFVFRTFQSSAKRAGVPVIRFHDLRHTAATLMMIEGVHPKIVQEQLGHSSVNMTLGRYSHVGETMQREAALKLTETLGLSDDRAQNVTNSDSIIAESASGLDSSG